MAIPDSWDAPLTPPAFRPIFSRPCGYSRLFMVFFSTPLTTKRDVNWFVESKIVHAKPLLESPSKVDGSLVSFQQLHVWMKTRLRRLTHRHQWTQLHLGQRQPRLEGPVWACRGKSTNAFFTQCKLPKHGCYAISVLQVWRATNVITAKCLNRHFQIKSNHVIGIVSSENYYRRPRIITSIT